MITKSINLYILLLITFDVLLHHTCPGVEAYLERGPTSPDVPPTVPRIIQHKEIKKELARKTKAKIEHGKNCLGNHLEEDEIGESGSKFIKVMKEIRDRANVTDSNVTEPSNPEVSLLSTCPFATPIECIADSPYRREDGSCNNLENPYWGRANTPFNRFLPAEYIDGISLPRNKSVTGEALPEPRSVTIAIHRNSGISDLSPEFTHFTMTFGQFLNHDMISTATFRHDLDCCVAEDEEQCMRILLPNDDPYFAAFNKDCLPFTRTLTTPPLSCQPGAKEVLDRQTSFIDCSQVYGKSREESLSLRAMSNGLLLTTPAEEFHLLPLDNSSFCRVPDNFCFIAGDFRVNQNSMLVTIQTIFLREHNRIAKFLSDVNPNLDDETLFQESRRINIAQMQKIVYGEYLPHILGQTLMQSHELQLLTSDFIEYSPNVNPTINVAFSGAAFRFGHSTIRSSFSNGIGQQVMLATSFARNDPFYVINNAVSNFIRGLLADQSQTVDRLITDQVTDRMFESVPGKSFDLASINIQRGRDIGLRPYIYWRQWCRLPLPKTFQDLLHHTQEEQIRLSNVYPDVADIDLWTGGLSEIHLNGSSLGPTFACIIGRQFSLLKSGDRFWFENAGPHRFTSSQLATIRQTSQSRILCDNSVLVSILADPFVKQSDTNAVVSCDSLPEVNLCLFARSMSNWYEWSACEMGTRRRQRDCLAPSEGLCACDESLTETDIESCE